MYSGILWLCLNFLNKSNFNVHCLIRSKNKCIGKFGSVMQSPEMKFFSKLVLLFLLNFFHVPLEALSGLILPGYDCDSVQGSYEEQEF